MPTITSPSTRRPKPSLTMPCVGMGGTGAGGWVAQIGGGGVAKGCNLHCTLCCCQRQRRAAAAPAAQRPRLMLPSRRPAPLPPHLHASLVSGRAGRHIQHQHPLQPHLAQRLRGPNSDAQYGAHHSAVHQYLLHQAAHCVGRGGRSEGRPRQAWTQPRGRHPQQACKASQASGTPPSQSAARQPPTHPAAPSSTPLTSVNGDGKANARRRALARGVCDRGVDANQAPAAVQQRPACVCRAHG